MKQSDEPIECNSEIGITIGLIDSIMASANALHGRDWNHCDIIEAIKDLKSNTVLLELMMFSGVNYDILKQLYEIDRLESIMRS
jgi:hypothetical protein